MTQEQKTYIAKRICKACHPLLFPFLGSTIGLVILYGHTPYLARLLWIPVVILILTFILPRFLIWRYRVYYHKVYPVSDVKKMENIPDIIVLTGLLAGYYFQKIIFLPHLISCMTAAAIVIFLFKVISKSWWNVSLHCAAWGAVAGMLIAYSLLFFFNPVWWICLAFAMGGIIGSCLIFLNWHSLSEVTQGFLFGLAIATIAVMIS